MPKLTIRRGETHAEVSFSGVPLLSRALAEAGFAIQQPCGGRGACGKCAVLALSGAVSAPSAREAQLGARLACQARLLGDCAVELYPPEQWAGILTGTDAPALGQPMPGRYGAAVDLGTTTVAARVFDLQTGQPFGEGARVNPQTAVAADVMSRLSAALAGELPRLAALAREGVTGAIADACAQAGVPGVDAAVVAGNTAMLTLLSGRDPRALATAPFITDCLFGLEQPLGGVPAYLPPCAAAFMGADLTCAALATGLCEQPETTLLMDIGTNGELMLWHAGRLYAASAAAGPAFEGGEISQGLGGVVGAIDRVWVENGTLGVRVIGGKQATGVCGSGLMDAVAALLTLGRIDPSGASDAPAFALAEGVCLTAGDVRAVQLAKAAIAAAVETLFDAAGVTPAQVGRLLLAGGFGSRLSIASAAAIGLIPPALTGKARAVGNASLAGASALLLDTALRARADSIAASAQVLSLGGNAAFERRFMAAIPFPGASDGEEDG